MPWASLTRPEWQEIEQLLARSDEARKFVEEIRQTAAGLPQELQKEQQASVRPAAVDHKLIEQTLKECGRRNRPATAGGGGIRALSIAATLCSWRTVGLVPGTSSEPRPSEMSVLARPAPPSSLATRPPVLPAARAPSAPGGLRGGRVQPADGLRADAGRSADAEGEGRD